METEKELTGYPSIDKPWLKYYTEEAINASLPDCTVYETIYNGNKDYLDDIALMYFGKKISYKTMFEQIDKTAKAFTALGVKTGDNVALCMPAIPETIYSVLALNKIGANANMLNPTFTAEQLTDRINDTGASVLVVINELYNLLETVIPNTSIKTVVACPAVNSLGAFVKIAKKVKPIPNTISWNDFIKNGKAETITIPPYETNSPAIMVYSSGTTGASKGIQLTNTGINASIVECGPYTYGFKRKERYFLQIPVWFSTGIITTGLVPLCYGVCLILEPIYDFNIFEKEIAKYKPNYMITATGLVNHIMTKPHLSSSAKYFKCLAIGGEGITENAEKRINEWLNKNGNSLNLRKGYGMCECCGAVTNTELNCNPLSCSGIPTPHVTVSAFDLETGEEQKYGERGEIRVLSPCRMLGYYKNSKETDKYFHTDEKGNVWACTGDMGYVTEDGCVYVSGRINDSYINEQNETIYLFDIERAVLDIPQVRQCKAVASYIDGKTVHVCHIVLDSLSNKSEIIRKVTAHCAEKLIDSYQPYLYRFHDDALPVASSGKLDIINMREDIENLFDIRVESKKQ
ncbi:MAG: acyl--CoA ligase [Oscillospiraceae bacterium]|nr:acyl--CoA ligase [Candidatus Ruminococcus equi]